MRIYVGHPKSIDYRRLYQMIREDEELKDEEIILPHEESANSANSRDFYTTIDLFFAEISEKATGLGIELGFAYDDGVEIHCLCQKGKKISNSVRVLTDNIYEYETIEDMMIIIKKIIELRKKEKKCQLK